MLQHPRDRDGSLRLPTPPRPPSAVEELTQLLRSRGVPEHLIPQQVAQMRAAAQKRPERHRGKK